MPRHFQVEIWIVWRNGQMPKTRKKSERRGDVEEADQARLTGR